MQHHLHIKEEMDLIGEEEITYTWISRNNMLLLLLLLEVYICLK